MPPKCPSPSHRAQLCIAALLAESVGCVSSVVEAIELHSACRPLSRQTLSLLVMDTADCPNLIPLEILDSAKLSLALANAFAMPAGEEYGAVVLIDAILTALRGVSHALCFTDSDATAKGLTAAESGAPQFNFLLSWLGDKWVGIQFLGEHQKGERNIMSDRFCSGCLDLVLQELSTAGIRVKSLKLTTDARAMLEAAKKKGSRYDSPTDDANRLQRLHASAVERIEKMFASCFRGALGVALKAFTRFANACPERTLFFLSQQVSWETGNTQHETSGRSCSWQLTSTRRDHSK